ncbi:MULTISPECIES: DUF6376 family protein [Bacillus]|jgi:hypothetical protein|uniref:Lipoprotein n=1 Tax=Bacillus toyonensis TaxID=155322 RepID=A0A1X3MTX0_9BACI|nr:MULTISPECIES: DUF6376 family protein [Bacillus]AFU12575.1 putative lipoprotein [Bacillus thuringiensis MC28]EEL23315.1 hypothetical protein bcere0017_17590 [Bacillus cereus Rock1-3]EEL34985.1 hypothetical protein bcere0019_17430 [Bacillus cereus Rock3-28]KNH40310.1 lipoprotein [Bacillus thuringiensis]KXY11117.1 hypothetical protein AT259_28240 [Bacillus cereus]MDH8704293.1 hypothetical protein [Stenotrophomonas sp. 1198]OTW85534.1 hypothetical protein BK702_19050 [Bacillus thuringiensis s
MKIKSILLVLIVSIGLIGCSIVEEGKNSLDYAQKATDYVNEISAFANEAPALAEKAVNDKEARKELEAKLNEIKQDIPAFNELTPPDVAKDLHQQIVGYNEKLNTLIDTSMKKVEEGKIDVEQFKNSELMQTMDQVRDLKDKIQNLGQ